MSTLKKTTPLFALSVLLLIAIAGTAQAGNRYNKSAQENIVRVLMTHSKFSTLATAVESAGLVDTLEGPGPFTVFAPDDAAFDKLPPGTLDGLLKDPEKLRSVLLFHVVEGRQMFGHLDRSESLMTANGDRLPVTVHAGAYFVGHARIIGHPIRSSNGIIYTITRVLIPPSQ